MLARNRKAQSAVSAKEPEVRKEQLGFLLEIFMQTRSYWVSSVDYKSVLLTDKAVP
jgi:hypothetical protein|tara:strand:- start:3413 stop:3580 length:168 start_codon:yes stop_codon:yes gene_type:complete